MPTLTERIRVIVDALPADSSITLPSRTLREWLDEESIGNGGSAESDRAADPSWRTLIWECPDDTRLGIAELCEAVGKSKAWVYRRTCATGSRLGYGAQRDRIPHAKVAGQLVFIASEIRDWLRQRERAAA